MATNTPASRQSKLRNRKRQEGLSPVMLWLPIDCAVQLHRIKRLRRLRNMDQAAAALCEIAANMPDIELATSQPKNEKGA